MSIYIYIFMYIYICLYICIYIYIRIYTYTEIVGTDKSNDFDHFAK